MFFAGLDLAWTPHHDSGLCLFELRAGEVRLQRLETLRRDPAGFAELLAGLEPGVVVAVDAPLIVSDARAGEQQLAARFRRYRAAPFLAREAFLASFGGTAGPELGAALRQRAFILDPGQLTPGLVAGRFAFEVFPHAWHVVAFGLPERIRYKKKRGMREADCRAGLATLQAHLRAHLARELPALLPDPTVAAALTPPPGTMTGMLRKALEDRLDALACACAAWQAWRDGVAAGDLFGDAADGFILVPGAERFFAGETTSAPAPSSP